MKPEPKKKLPNKKVISSAKFEAKEQFTKSALENLKTENGNILFVKRKKHAELIIKEFLQRSKFKDPNTLLNLTLFSCNLNKDEIEQIKKKIMQFLFVML